MSLVVRAIESEKGSLVNRAFAIHAIKKDPDNPDKGNVEQLVKIVSAEDYPKLTPSSKVVYVEGQVGSACRNSGLIVRTGQDVVGFIECKL